MYFRGRISNAKQNKAFFWAELGFKTVSPVASFGPTVRKGRVLHTSLSRVRHAHGGGFAGSEVWVTSQRLGGTRVAFLHARTPTHSPPDVKTGRGTPRSLHTLLHLRMSLFCLLRVLLFALGRVLTWLDLTSFVLGMHFTKSYFVIRGAHFTRSIIENKC
jgi:hypothetical protein